MAFSFRLPDLGEGVAEGEVVRWLVRAGQSVTEDQPLVEVMTDKATVEIPSPVAGTVSEILVEEGAVVPVGTVLVTFAEAGDDDGAAVPEPSATVAAAPASAATDGSATPAPGQRRHVFALPSVRRLARDLAVDLEAVKPSGPGARVTAEDVRRVAAGGRPVGTASPDAPDSSGVSAVGTVASAGVAAAPGAALTGVRRVIARRMEEAAAIPAVTVVEECDVTEVVATRAAARRPVSYLTFVLKACARALRDHPDLNATFRDGRLERRPVDGIGVAVHTDAGLVVPVVRRVEDRPLGDVDDDITRLAEAARGGRLTPADFEGAAFTVTSPGPLGGLMATPLINAPQVAILGVHRIGPRPVVRADQVVIRTMGNLSITFDHRVIDGVPAARFLLDVIRALEHPGLLLI